MNAVVEQKTDANKVLNTMGGKPTPCSEATCEPCHRVDLQLLVVTPSVIPKIHFQALVNAKYTWFPAFDQHLTAVKREATVPVARLAKPGYIYIYYPGRSKTCWDVWQVMNNSLMRQIVYRADTVQCSNRLSEFIDKGEPRSCSQGARNLSAHTICIEGAHAIDTAWIAYSAEIWPFKVLKRYEDNPSIDVPVPGGKSEKKLLRELRGRELLLKQIIAGKPSDGCIRLDNGVLNQFVADFVDKADENYLKAFSLSVNKIDINRIGHASSLVNRVRSIEKSSNTPENYEKKSVVIGLSDEIGVAEDLVQLRILAKEASGEWVRGGPNFEGELDDPLRPWKLRSSLHEQMIEDWVFGHNAEKWRYNASIGADVGKAQRTITRYEYDAIRRSEAETGRLHDAPGTQYITKDGDNWVHVIPPKEVLEKEISKKAREASKEMIERYRGKVRYRELTEFRTKYKEAEKKWSEQIESLDRDFVCWINQPKLAIVMKYDHDREVDLIAPDESQGTPAQRVNAWMSYVRSTGKVWGGGATTDVSLRELVKAYGKDFDAPAKWIDGALLSPFNVIENIYGEAGKQKDFVEKLNGLTRELPEKIKEILHTRHELYETHIHALMQASHQAAQAHAALVDPDRAKTLGRAVISVSEAEKAFRIQVRAAAVIDLMTNPKADSYVTINVKVQAGEALDEIVKQFQSGKLEIDLETKTETPRSRQTRKAMNKKLRKLAGRPGLNRPEYQSVILTRKRLAEFEKIAARQGEELVDVVVNETLSAHIPSKFKLPKTLAIKLIGEQTRAAISVRKALFTTGSGVAFVLACFQWNALWKSLEKLKDTEGVAFTDTLMTVFSSAAGLIEGATTVTSGYLEIQAKGSKLALASTVEHMTNMAAAVRLVGGIAAAAGSAFDAYSSYAKYCSAKSRGSTDSMNAYANSAGAFAVSSFSLLGSAGFGFAASSATRLNVSNGVVKAVGRAAVRAGVRMAAVEATEMLGTAIVATEMLAASLTGIGIVLAIAGFAWAIYAESLEDDLNEIFLKRSYWGADKAPMPPFGSGERPKIAIGSNGNNIDAVPNSEYKADKFSSWAIAGIKEEAAGFIAISVGLKCTVEWIKKDFINAKIEVDDGIGKCVNYALATLDVNSGNVLINQGSGEKFAIEEEGKGFSLKKQLPTEVFWDRTVAASFSYYVYEEESKEILAHETILLKRPA